MQVELTSEDPVGFRPFTLTITIDTPEEALALRALHGVSGSVAEAVVDNTSYPCGFDDGEEVAALYNRMFYQVHAYLQYQCGLTKEGFPDDR